MPSYFKYPVIWEIFKILKIYKPQIPIGILEFPKWLAIWEISKNLRIWEIPQIPIFFKSIIGVGSKEKD